MVDAVLRPCSTRADLISRYSLRASSSTTWKDLSVYSGAKYSVGLSKRVLAHTRESLHLSEAAIPEQRRSCALAGLLGSSAILPVVLRRRRPGRRHSLTAQWAEVNGSSTAADTSSFSVVDVERYWEEAEALGSKAEEIARDCALLCCVQRQLGYFAALHEGRVGRARTISRAPPLPVVLSWEGAGGLDEVYGMSLAANGASTLLHQLLTCGKHAHNDRRFETPSEASQLQAKVSLLRGFVDISATPTEWVPGQHGLWYGGPNKDGTRSLHVYLPEVTLRVGGSEPGPEAVQKVLRALPPWRRKRKRQAKGPLPQGYELYRFEALQGACAVASLPTMKTREVSDDNLRQMLLAHASLRPGQDSAGAEGANSRFAALTAKSDDPRVRAFIVPPAGTYLNSELGFSSGLTNVPPESLSKVQRIFVVAQVWDCFIDGCGIPERRCAWYGKLPLDLVVLEELRSSKAFSELTVEQDMRERAIEALLPMVTNCFDDGREFTIVPIFVGGVVPRKIETYAKLLAPYLGNSSNLFVVAGNADQLEEGGNGARRWSRELPIVVGKADKLARVIGALELFLAVLSQDPQREELSFSRYW